MCVCVPNFFIHSSVNGYLVCFHVLAIVNNAALNIKVQVCFQIIVLSGYMPRNGIAESHGNSSFSFWGTSILFSIVAAPSYIPTHGAQGLFRLHTLHVLSLLVKAVLQVCGSVSLWFWLALPWRLVMLSILSTCLFGHTMWLVGL